MPANPLVTPVDYVLLAGKKSPGIAEVVGASSPRKWDERNGYGLSGASLWFTGLGPAHFSVKCRLYTPQHWLDWHDWQSVAQKPPVGRRPQALDIWHPFLEDLGIKSVVVEDVLQPVLTHDTGEWTLEVKFGQQRKIRLQLSKPEGSKATPTDPYDVIIENLASQVQELANG